MISKQWIPRRVDKAVTIIGAAYPVERVLDTTGAGDSLRPDSCGACPMVWI